MTPGAQVPSENRNAFVSYKLGQLAPNTIERSLLEAPHKKALACVGGCFDQPSSSLKSAGKVEDNKDLCKDIEAFPSIKQLGGTHATAVMLAMEKAIRPLNLHWSRFGGQTKKQAIYATSKFWVFQTKASQGLVSK